MKPFLHWNFIKGWDYGRDDWKTDVVKCVDDLSPGMIRWGGNFSRYYKLFL
jgi:alpha-L-arabinofuranosidase